MALGFVGLGNMGGPMARRLVEAGFEVHVYDAAGTAERAPPGAHACDSVAAVAARAETVLLSLPDGKVVGEVAGEIAAAPERAARTVVDLSTVGIAAAAAVGSELAAAGLAYVDAPVSGGTAGAAAGTLAIMVACEADAFAALEPVLAPLSARHFHVGRRAGQGQAMKLLNNFLSATAMAATSEAVLFGVAHGLDAGTVIEVLNAATGRNTATEDKFPNRILPGRFDAGFATRLMTKDMNLYLEALTGAGGDNEVAAAVGEVWRRCEAALPDSDFTEVYAYLRDRAAGGEEKP